jgi:hypothetical protein
MKLPPETKSLCARIALERHRSTITKTSIELRKQAQALLTSGQPPMLVEAMLVALLGDALKAQGAGVR